jgi:hypothetical protein
VSAGWPADLPTRPTGSGLARMTVSSRRLAAAAARGRGIAEKGKAWVGSPSTVARAGRIICRQLSSRRRSPPHFPLRTRSRALIGCAPSSDRHSLAVLEQVNIPLSSFSNLPRSRRVRSGRSLSLSPSPLSRPPSTAFALGGLLPSPLPPHLTPRALARGEGSPEGPGQKSGPRHTSPTHARAKRSAPRWGRRGPRRRRRLRRHPRQLRRPSPSAMGKGSWVSRHSPHASRSPPGSVDWGPPL